MKKKLFFGVMLMLLGGVSMRAEQADVHRFANFNVRYVNANNGDTGDRLWANRRNYVAQIVTDYDFDIVAMEELTGNNKDAVTGKSQIDDLKDLLPGYTMIAYERENKKYSYTGLMYKTNKYTCLEHTSFWISQTPWVVSKGWTADENIYRRCVMAHMQVQATGEEFWFCAIHTNYGPSQCAIQGAKLVSQLVHQYAGQLPVVLAGDFNMSRSTHTEAYRGYASTFYDAALTTPAAQNYSIPTTNPNSTGTTSDWTPRKTNGNEFDYLFYDHMTPLSRHVITEYYGRSVTPSDHYPVLVRFRLGSADHPTRFYAHDEATLRDALASATQLDTVMVQAGTIALTSPLSIGCSVTLIGGYNSDYSSVTGTTTISASGLTAPVFTIPEWYSLRLENMNFVSDGTGTTANGGVVWSAGCQLHCKDCSFEGWQVSNQGGAIYAETDSLVLEGCRFVDCEAKTGGAVFAKLGGELVVKDCLLRGNKVSDSGAAVSASQYQSVNLQRSSFVENESVKQGTVYLAASSTATGVHVLNCSFLNNLVQAKKGLATATKRFGGSALHVSLASATQRVNVAHCTMMGNRTTFTGSDADIAGGALTVFGGKACVMNCLMLSNRLEAMSNRYVDCSMGEDVGFWRNTNNLTSDSVQIAGWEQVIDSTFAGDMTAGFFRPEVTDAGGYTFLKPTLAGQSLKYISTQQRLCESAFSYDLNGDGTIGGYVHEDMLGADRAIKTCPGALEYSDGVSDALEEHWAGSEAGCRKVLRAGQVVLIVDDNEYAVTGQRL